MPPPPPPKKKTLSRGFISHAHIANLSFKPPWTHAHTYTNIHTDISIYIYIHPASWNQWRYATYASEAFLGRLKRTAKRTSSVTMARSTLARHVLGVTLRWQKLARSGEEIEPEIRKGLVLHEMGTVCLTEKAFSVQGF